MTLILAIIVVLWIVFIFDFHATLETKKNIYGFKYSGLLWVLLDRYITWKYDITDISMKMFNYTKQNKND